MLNENLKKNRQTIIKSWFMKSIDFKSIIFTDEARFSIQGPDNFQSWQLHNGTNEEIRDKKPFKGGSIIVFLDMAYDETFLIRKIDGTLNGERYLNLLKEDIMPELLRKFGSNFIFQQTVHDLISVQK